MYLRTNLILFLFLLLLLNIVIVFLIILESRKKKKEALSEGKIVGVWKGIERRRFKRIKAELFVRYEVSDSSKVQATVSSRDISQGGIGLILYERLKEGTPLRIWIEVPSKKEKLFLLGEIVWQREVTNKSADKRVFFAGVRFSTIDIPTQLRLANFISSLELEEQGTKDERTDSGEKAG